MFLFSITIYQDFAQKLAKHAHLKFGRLEIKKFSDGEIYVRVAEEVAKQDVYVVGTTMPPADNLVELVLLVNALKTAGAHRVIAIVPYFGYSRADHIVKAGEALSAKFMADLLKCAEISRVITVDIHSPKVEKFFKIQLVNIKAQKLLAEAIVSIVRREKKVVVAPDHGALPLALRMAHVLDAQTAWMEKVRPRPNVARIGALHGDVSGKTAVLIDDMIDTAGTIVEAVNHLQKEGAKKVFVAATHPIFSGTALDRLKKAKIDRIFVTDTIPLPPEKKFSKLHIVSVVNLIAKFLR